MEERKDNHREFFYTTAGIAFFLWTMKEVAQISWNFFSFIMGRI